MTSRVTYNNSAGSITKTGSPILLEQAGQQHSVGDSWQSHQSKGIFSHYPGAGPSSSKTADRTPSSLCKANQARDGSSDPV